MTKTLLLIRHSKTESRNGSIIDFERSLTPEGKSESKKMAKYLLDSGITPDLIITSSAARAFETTAIFAEIFNTVEENITATRKLYYCSAKTILDQIYGLPENISCVMVVAHNPGISDLTRGLSAGKAFFMDNTQVAILKYDMEQWYQIDEKKPVTFLTQRPLEITP